MVIYEMINPTPRCTSIPVTFFNSIAAPGSNSASITPKGLNIAIKYGSGFACGPLPPYCVKLIVNMVMIAVPAARKKATPYVQTIATIVLRMSVEKKTPILPKVAIESKYTPNVRSNSFGDIPPNKNTMLYKGKLEITINSRNDRDDTNLLTMILVEDCCVVNRMFKVCFSLSLLMIPAVSPGVIKKIKASCTNAKIMNMFLLFSARNIPIVLNLVSM